MSPRRRTLLLAGAAALIVVVGAAVVALVFFRDGDGDDEVLTGPQAEQSSVDDFGELGVTIRTTAGREVASCLLSADTDEQRQQGLMERTDLAGYDGMIFRYPRARTRHFWMRNTPLPLSIAFFDGQGSFVSATDMTPCGDRDDCPYYSSGTPAQYAIEVPKGELPSIGAAAGSRLTIDGACRR